MIEQTISELEQLPRIELLKEQEQGTLVLWRDFDVLSKASDGQVFDTLSSLKDTVYDSIALIFHRFLNSSARHKISIYVNNQKVRPKDPF